MRGPVEVCAVFFLLAGSVLQADVMPEFERLFREAASIREAMYGSSHPKTAAALRDLGLLLLEAGKPAESEPFLRRSLAITEANSGSESVEAARDLVHLAVARLDQGDGDEPERLLRQALSIHLETKGSGAGEGGEVMLRLAALLEAKGHLKHKRSGREYIYRPTVPRSRASRAAAKRLLTTFFEGSAPRAVAALLSVSKDQLSTEDVKRLTELIEEAENTEE